MTLKEILQHASQEHWSTGHFNASEFDQVRAIAEACKEVGAPAIIGTSEGERKHMGLIEALAVRDAFRKDFGIPIFLNADHCKSVESAKETVEAGYDSVHIDLSKLSLEDNIGGTKEIVASAREKDKDISVEGEVGYFVTEASKVYKEVFEIPPESLTKPEEAERFVKETGVDRLAIAVGNIHGISLNEPHLDIARIKAIRERISKEVTLVLHAGSGIPEDQIRAAIEAGIANIHISTELRLAFVNALKESLATELDEVAMYKLDQSAIVAMKELVKEKLRLFGSEDKLKGRR
ncbi:MAG: class II fructose-bisphosphate aldolase [Candidatus Sungiibacteriota bacterium]|uniref:Class II fructose-bisphosphate aldolase n=1 Tax=Candidatus Sungiibacteriota bacterium TaxID=2750080 RepID=A0A7T5US76_9BACT|nr:MAG: class II fructose-bisphosphate aldolase [Candidatus Sungbacteria bacterium]